MSLRRRTALARLALPGILPLLRAPPAGAQTAAGPAPAEPLLPGIPAEPAEPGRADTTIQWLPTADVGGWPLLTTVVGEGDAASRATWIIDTGATHHAADPRWAAEQRLSPSGRQRLTTATGTQTVSLFELPPMRSGSLAWPSTPAVAFDMRAYEELTGMRLAGILGQSLWNPQSLTLDMSGLRLLANHSPPWPDALTLPLQWDAGLPVLHLSVADGPPEPWLLDTGNPGALVVFAHRARTWLAPGSPLPRLRVREPGGDIDIACGLVSSLRAEGRILARDIPAVLEAGSAARRGAHFDRLAGSLGSALLAEGGLTLNQRDNKVTLRLRAEPLPGGFGFTLRRTPDGGSAVQAVLGNSPAERAGLQPGDRLLQLGQDDVRFLVPTQVWQRLQGSETARLLWQRGDIRRDTPLARDRFFPRLT